MEILFVISHLFLMSDPSIQKSRETAYFPELTAEGQWRRLLRQPTTREAQLQINFGDPSPSYFTSKFYQGNRYGCLHIWLNVS